MIWSEQWLIDQGINVYFAEQLLDWYDENKRDLPWRKNNDPYRVWVSEIMLQQTRVDTVIPYYERFMEKFPTLDALAEAPEDEVLKSWEGLGYYSRARNLHAAAKEVKARYGSRVPDNKRDILSLKGIGPYTAGAILSIAFGQPEPAIDGNVMRVLSRFFLITDDIAKPSTRTAMEELLRETIPTDRAGDFNQALMEFGALLCTPKGPHCLICPVMSQCRGRLEGMEQSLPVKKKAKPPRPVQRLVAFVEGEGEQAGKFLIRRRPDGGLLAKLWELPHYELSEASKEMMPSAFLERHLLEEDGLAAVVGEWMLNAEHTFSHLHWELQVYRCRGQAVSAHALPREQYRWISIDDMADYTFPNVFIRILEHIHNGAS